MNSRTPVVFVRFLDGLGAANLTSLTVGLRSDSEVAVWWGLRSCTGQMSTADVAFQKVYEIDEKMFLKKKSFPELHAGSWTN